MSCSRCGKHFASVEYFDENGHCARCQQLIGVDPRSQEYSELKVCKTSSEAGQYDWHHNLQGAPYCKICSRIFIEMDDDQNGMCGDCIDSRSETLASSFNNHRSQANAVRTAPHFLCLPPSNQLQASSGSRSADRTMQSLPPPRISGPTNFTRVNLVSASRNAKKTSGIEAISVQTRRLFATSSDKLKTSEILGDLSSYLLSGGYLNATTTFPDALRQTWEKHWHQDVRIKSSYTINFKWVFSFI
jgi:hypothetical protein